MGIDFGTTRCKVGVYSRDGQEVAAATAYTPTHEDGFGTAWLAEKIWSTIALLISEVIQRSPEDIEAISVSSVGESGVCLDGSGNPLFPIIAWYDARSSAQRAWWAESFGEEHIRSITGLPLDHIYSLCKLMWLREQFPGVFAKVQRFLLIADWFIYKLTNVQVTNYSLASRTMALDLAKRQWSSDLLEAVGIKASIFAPLVPSGQYVGGVLPSMARELGIKAGTSVVTGGHDHICASLGAGVVFPGQIMNSIGTSETALSAIVGDPGKISTSGLALGHHVVPDTYYAMGTMRASAVCIEWGINEVLGIASDILPETRYRALIDSAGKGRAAESGLFFLPQLRGSLIPNYRPLARGVFLGLEDRHTREDMVKAIIEGVCFDAAFMIEHVAETTGNKPQRITVVGGGTRNPLWLQTKADVLNLPVDVPSVDQAAPFGAAMLAGLGVGVYTDVREAVAQNCRIARTYLPDPERVALYAHAYSRYKKIRQPLIDLFEGKR